MRKYPESLRRNLRHLTWRSAKTSKKQSPSILRACSSKLTVFCARKLINNRIFFVSGPKNPLWRIGRDFCQKSRTWSWVKQTKSMSYIRLKVSPQHIFLFYLYQLLINLWYYDHFVIRRQSRRKLFSAIFCILS